MSLTKLFKRQPAKEQEVAKAGDQVPSMPEEFKDPFEDPTSVGNILMNKLGKITRDQLHQAVGRKAATDDMLLGALLKDMGFVSAHDVARALKIQADMRSGNDVDAAFCALDARLDEALKATETLTKTTGRVQTKRRPTGELRLVLPEAVLATAKR